MDRAGAPVCTVCRSTEVRASRSSYPHDQAVLGGREGSFWRCRNCGARFLGPRAPEQKRRGHGRRRSHRDKANEVIEFGRLAKRWVFPLLVLLATILAVIYILDQRAPPLERIILPRP